MGERLALHAPRGVWQGAPREGPRKREEKAAKAAVAPSAAPGAAAISVVPPARGRLRRHIRSVRWGDSVCVCVIFEERTEAWHFLKNTGKKTTRIKERKSTPPRGRLDHNFKKRAGVSDRGSLVSALRSRRRRSARRRAWRTSRRRRPRRTRPTPKRQVRDSHFVSCPIWTLDSSKDGARVLWLSRTLSIVQILVRHSLTHSQNTNENRKSLLWLDVETRP